MNQRHRAREIALQILYQYDSRTQNQSSVDQDLLQKMIQELQQHFDHFEVPTKLREFVGQLVAGTLTELKEIDLTIEKHAAHWKIHRMSSVDRCLLRMAVYELQYLKSAPVNVILDEAIELGKQFGTAETPSFVNGILDSIRASLT